MPPFTPSERAYCLSVLALLESKPIHGAVCGSFTYRSPADAESHPISLPIIAGDVASGAIDDVKTFVRSVHTWLALIPQRKDRCRRAIVGALRSAFDKKMNPLRDRQSWLKACAGLLRRLDAQLHAAPPIAEFTPPPERRVPAQSEANFLFHAIQKVVSPADLFKVIEILGQDSSRIPTCDRPILAVDLKRLDPATFFRLFDFLSERFPDNSFDLSPERSARPPEKRNAMQR
jgi:hypothetical protein